MVRRLVIAATISMGLTGAAMAASLPAPSPPSAYNWSGIYGGLNAGYGWGSGGAQLQGPGLADPLFAPAVNSGSYATSIPFHRSGFVGGDQIGVNYQISALVFGVEADLDAGHISGSSTINTHVLPFSLPGAFTAGSTLQWLGTVRGRLGFTPIDRWLVYATGGLAYGSVERNYLGGYPVAPGGPQTLMSDRTSLRTGWTVGGGVEWAFAGNWSVKGEYLHYDLGSNTDVGRASPALQAGLPDKLFNKFSEDSGDIVRFGVNYKFF